MDSIEKIGKIEVISLLITVISNNIIINIPTVIIDSTGTGSWVNLIYLTILCFIFIIIVCKLFKPFINADIVDVSEFLGGKILKYIIALSYIAFFMLFSIFGLRYFSHNLQNIYYNDTPLVFLVLIILIPVVLAGRTGLKAISGNNLIFTPVAVIAIILLFVVASREFVFERLFPILGHGTKETFLTSITNLFGFNVVAYLYFLKPFLKKETEFKKISIITVIICGIYLLFSVLSLLMTFSFITQTDENLSLHLLTRLVNFGNFLQRVDAIFVFIWILALLSYLSLNLYLMSYIFKKLFNLKSTTEFVYPLSAFLFSFTLLIKNMAVVKSFTKNIAKGANPTLVFVISFILLLLAYIKKKKRGIHI